VVFLYEKYHKSVMPHTSNRAVLLKEVGDSVISTYLISDCVKLCDDDSSASSDSSEENATTNVKLLASVKCLGYSTLRFVHRTPMYRPNVRGKWNFSGIPEWQKIVSRRKYNEEEFIKLFRIPHGLFHALCDLRDQRVFSRNGLRQCKHYSIELHMLVLLKYLGSEGYSSSSIAVKEGLGIGKGSVRNYLLRAIKGIMSLFNQTVFWPHEDEMKEISSYFHAKYKFAHFISVIDGMHLGLAFKPELHRGDYFTQNQQYAISTAIVCDHEKKIHFLNIGWPGSVHDQRMFQNSTICKNFQQFFYEREYIVGDSAYTPSSYMVPAYKKYGGQVILFPGQIFFQ